MKITGYTARHSQALLAAAAILGVSCIPLIPVRKSTRAKATVRLSVSPEQAEGLVLLFRPKASGVWVMGDGPGHAHLLDWHKPVGEFEFVPPKKVTQGFAGPMTLAGSSSDEAELLVVARGFEPQWTDLLDAYKDENQDTLLDVRINLKSYDSVHHRFQELADLWGWLQETEYGYDDVPEKYLPHISGEDWAPLVQIPAEVRAELNELLCKETVPLGDLSQDEQEGWHQDARELAKRICSAV